jgi:hypothetical protein
MPALKGVWRCTWWQLNWKNCVYMFERCWIWFSFFRRFGMWTRIFWKHKQRHIPGKVSLLYNRYCG